MTTDERLAHLSQRLDHVIAAMDDLASLAGTNNEMLVKLMEWLQKPPSSELPDLLRAVVEQTAAQGERIGALTTQVMNLAGRVSEVPKATARLLQPSP